MAQYDFGTIDPDETGGTELAVMLNQYRDAMHSMHKGAARPAYAVAGMCWVDDSGTPWLIKRYDGTDDVIEAEYNATDDVVSYRSRTPVITKTAAYAIVAADFGRLVKVDAAADPVTITLPAISAVKAGFPITIVRVNAGANAVTVQRAGSDTIGGAAASSYVLGQRDQALVLSADAAGANWVVVLASPSILDTPSFTGLMTVAGVKVASGTVSGTLTMAEHSGGVFLVGSNIVCPNEAGFSVTLIATSACTVQVATGAAQALAEGDMFTLAIPVINIARAVRTPAADVLTMGTS